MQLGRLVGVSPAIRRVTEDVEWAARSDAKVLITGESGVGKEVVARLVHELSNRSRNSLVPINCAGIPETLLASELFGHVRGSFTDAHRDRAGWLEQANRGTVFLDEVGEMSLQMQALLLRFLENGEIQRVGSDLRGSRVDVRVICATNRNLFERVKAGEFREDLYYRLNVIHIEIPPLRHRSEDVPHLVEYLLGSLAQAHRVAKPQLHEDTMARLVQYEWPGNVRELRNVVERLVVRWRSGAILPSQLPESIATGRGAHNTGQQPEALPVASRAQLLYDEMTLRRESFWSVVYEPFKSRDLTRQDLRNVIRLGLIASRGSYKGMVRLFNMPDDDYKRLLNFLRKHEAHLPIHEFRVMTPRVQADAIRKLPMERPLSVA
jgi:transcriptional regulator with GAF, ATPase, and Fis domain